MFNKINEISYYLQLHPLQRSKNEKMICKIFIIASLFITSILSQHCTYDDVGFRSVACYRLNNSYLSKVTGIQTSKYLYDSFKCVNCILGAIQPNSFNVGSREKSSFRSMDLEASGISEIKPHGFGYQGQVRKLVLSGNMINILYASNFVDLTYLEYLNISSNFIQKLSTNTFQGLNYLKILDLENNNITSIDNYAFRDLEELQVLNMKRNKLTVLRYGMFFGAIHLKSLLFGLNFINSIDNQALTSLAALEELDLSNNRLASMPTELLTTAKQIRSLDLSHSNFAVITISSETLEELKLFNISLLDVEVQLKCTLPSLLRLDLGKNNISVFRVEFFAQFPLLNNLSLMENQISKIDTSGKLQLRSLLALELSSNNLTAFDFHELMYYAPQLTYIGLKWNPLFCDFKEKTKKYFYENTSIKVALSNISENCNEYLTEKTTIAEYVVKNKTVDISDPACEHFTKRIMVLTVVLFVIILTLLVSTLCLQCCQIRRSMKDTYAVSSTNLPLVNLSK